MAIDRDNEKFVDEQATSGSRQSNTLSTAERASPPQPASLMTLPAELRNAIYEYVVVPNAPIGLHYVSLTFSGTPVSVDGRRRLTQPALARTSRRLRCETLPVFYGQNAFKIEFADDWERKESVKWLQAIGPSNRKLLLDVTLRYRCNRSLKKPLRRDESIAKYYGKHGIALELDSFERDTWVPIRGSCKVTFK